MRQTTNERIAPAIHYRPEALSFNGRGLRGYSFGPLRQDKLEIYHVEVEKGHDTFMVSRKITRTYYVITGSGYFTINSTRYDVEPGMLIEVPPRVEYSYSGRMTLLVLSIPRWFSGNDVHTKWNKDVVRREDYLIKELPFLTRLSRYRIFGKSPVGAWLRINRYLWIHCLSYVQSLKPVESYGRALNELVRRHGARMQASSTYFLRNRPELELIRRLVEKRGRGETIRVTVLGCSNGAEAYSVSWRIRSARPDLHLIMNAVDISPEAVECGRSGVYSARRTRLTGTDLFERLTPGEMEEMFDISGERISIKPWIREGITWRVDDGGEPEIVDTLGLQDIVIANNFLCHMETPDADRCLRNMGKLLAQGGHLFVGGVDLDVRSRVAHDLGWNPVEELLEEIHEGDPCLRRLWPWHYGGLEPLNKKRSDWKTRYASAFQISRDLNGIQQATDEYVRAL